MYCEDQIVSVRPDLSWIVDSRNSDLTHKKFCKSLQSKYRYDFWGAKICWPSLYYNVLPNRKKCIRKKEYSSLDNKAVIVSESLCASMHHDMSFCSLSGREKQGQDRNIRRTDYISLLVLFVRILISRGEELQSKESILLLKLLWTNISR